MRMFRGMDISMMIQAITAVIVGNLVTGLFLFALYVTHKLQKEEHLGDSELPLWVYPCLMAAGAICVVGFYLIPVG